AEPRPSATSRVRQRIRRRSPSFASAMFPSTKPVSVMRSQKRARSPRNVSANSPNAAARPAAVTARLARGKRRDHEAEHHEVAERGVELRGLEGDQRDDALPTASAGFGRT